MALPKLANETTSVYMMNVNTKPASQKQIRYSKGSLTCTFRNSILPTANTVVWQSDTKANTPKRPRNN